MQSPLSGRVPPQGTQGAHFLTEFTVCKPKNREYLMQLCVRSTLKNFGCTKSCRAGAKLTLGGEKWEYKSFRGHQAGYKWRQINDRRWAFFGVLKPQGEQ